MLTLHDQFKNDLINFTCSSQYASRTTELLAKINRFVESRKNLLFAACSDTEVQISIKQLHHLSYEIDPQNTSPVFRKFDELIPTLNRDVARIILENLSPYEIARLKTLSKVVNAAASDAQIESLNHARGSFDKCNFLTGTQIIKFLEGKNRTLFRHLDLTEIHLVPGEFEMIIEGMTQLLSLKVSSKVITDSSLGARLMHLTELEEFSLVSKNVSGAGLCSTLPHLPKLRKLRFDIPLSAEECYLLHPLLKSITHLDLSDSAISDEEMFILAPSLTELKSLNLSETLVAECLPVLITTKIISLNLVGSNVTGACLLSIADKLPNIRELHFGYNALRSEKLGDLIPLTLAPYLSKLETLELRGTNCHFTMVGLTALALHTKNLRHVILSDLPDSGFFIGHLLDSNPHIESLDLEGGSLCSNFLRLQPRQLSQLKKLRLLRADQRQPFIDGIETASKLISLRELSIVNSCVTDSFISAIACNLTDLRILNLNGCKLLTNDSLYAVAPYLSRLEQLHLSDLSRCTDGGLFISLSQSLTKVTHLDLSYMHLSDETLLNIIKHLNKLRRLNISHCRGLTDNFLVRAKPKFTYLKRFDFFFSKFSLPALRELLTFLKNNKSICIEELNATERILACMEKTHALEAKFL